MAKRMKFSVVGLPHYTIWHLYEPSVDDLRHMDEMEKERQAQEQIEREHELADKQKQSSNSESQNDAEKGSSEGPAAQPPKDVAKGNSKQDKS